MGFWGNLFKDVFKTTEEDIARKNAYQTGHEMVKIGNDFLTKEDVCALEQKSVIDYFKENETLLFNVVLPMYKLAIDNEYIDTQTFSTLLKEAFVLDNKADTILGKMNNINFYSKQYYNKLEKKIYNGVRPSNYQISKYGTPSVIVRSDAVLSFKDLYIARIYFLMYSNENWAKDLLKDMNYYFNCSESKKLVTEFIKNSYLFTFAKMFAFKKLADEINSNKKSEFYKIIHNAINKFGSHDQIAEKTYNIFIDSFYLSENNFTLVDYMEFISFMVQTINDNISLYDDSIIEKLDLNDLSKSKLLQYNSAQLAKSIIYFKMVKKEDLVSYFKEYQTLDTLTKTISDLQNKQDLLYNDYSEEDKITIDDVDLMSGVEFEAFVKGILEKMGYKCRLTKTTGDQGIDILAEKDKIKIAIQTKCYSAKVGNHAIMEAFAGMKHYNATKCMVITNNYFTKSAIELAKSNNVVLWNRDTLIDKMYN